LAKFIFKDPPLPRWDLVISKGIGCLGIGEVQGGPEGRREGQRG